MKLRLGLLLVALGASSACDNVGGEVGRGEAVPAVAPPRISPVELLPPSVDRSVTRRVEVRDPPAIPAVQVDIQRQADGIVDILWVVDDSGSMANQRQTLTNNFSRFLNELLALQVRFQIGVISTNYNDRGMLRGGTTKIITNETPNPQQVFLQNTSFPNASRVRLEQGLRMMDDRVEEKLPHVAAPALVIRGALDPQHADRS